LAENNLAKGLQQILLHGLFEFQTALVSKYASGGNKIYFQFFT